MWFRNDLRTIDNPALSAAMANGITRAVFYVTIPQWQKHDWGNNKISFVLQHILNLQAELNKLNIQLDIQYCNSFSELPELLIKYIQQLGCAKLFYNQEYELNENLRDQAVNKLFAKHNIPVKHFHEQCLIQPGIILTKQNTPYTVFTPFKRSCYEYLYNHQPNILIKLKPQAIDYKININNIIPEHQHYLDNHIVKNWPLGQQAALKLLDNFCIDKIQNYKQARDFPALDATSSLSPYLAIGAISVKQCYLTAISCNTDDCWVSELIWRDFYRNIIFHFPDICKGKNFNTKYDKLKWQAPGNNLLLWQQGKTGIPIIDAAMRQLVNTGWMHNRLRMVVAMFLTKNLLIDWRHGEKFFSEHLLDLDFASNNGGWQWSASTGTDAVPYFRIFNPITQSQKFDPEGIFIKKYCPELKNLSAKEIHNPSNIPNYPPLMVDISKSRLRAIEYFKNL